MLILQILDAIRLRSIEERNALTRMTQVRDEALNKRNAQCIAPKDLIEENNFLRLLNSQMAEESEVLNALRILQEYFAD